MNIKNQYISTSKTAKIATYGVLSATTKQTIIVLHGYGYLANNFIKRFSCLDENEYFIVVPEALNRFYVNGMSGKVGASWMTTEERANEIQDYLTYFDNIYNGLNLQLSNKLTILGFSQGGATGARWFQHTTHTIDNLVFWGASIPDEVLNEEKIKHTNVVILYGDEDKFITPELVDTHKKRYDNVNLKFSQIFYKGGHDILTEPLLELFDGLIYT